MADGKARTPLPTLLPGERIERVEQLELIDPLAMPSALAELCELAGVERPEEIGDNGPVMASRVDANADKAELRLFEKVFGRDSLLVALIVADLFPRLLESTIVYLGSRQGRVINALREEEPGRILHETGQHEQAFVDHPHQQGQWGFPYYGSVDATPLYIQAAARAIARRSEFAHTPLGDGRTVLDALGAAVDWLLARLAADELGVLSHLRANPHGLENQVWKDSWDSFSHADGSVSNRQAPRAAIEAQALAFDALHDALPLLAGPAAVAAAAAARRLQAAVEQHLWLPDENCYALGLDRDPADGSPRPFKIHGSNIGWLLNSRLLDGAEQHARRRRIVELLMSDEFLAEGGIRTLSRREVRFRPRAYHNGNVWLFDNYLIARGFARHGFNSEAEEIDGRIIAACHATHRFPEFVAGGERGEPLIADRVVDLYDEINQHANRVEQPPQEIQAWTVAAVCALENT